MPASRILTARVVIGLIAISGCLCVHASDPWPEPRPIALDTAAFRAPEEPPEDEAAQEALAPEPEAPLALQDALALALMRNPELAVFSWDVRAGEARALQAGKAPNPELDIRLQRLGIPRASAEPDDLRRRVILSQDFELGRKRHRRVVLAEMETDLAGWDYEAKRIEVATLVTGHFVAVLGAQRRVESSRRLVEFLEAMRDRVLKLVETGTMRNLELHQVARQVGLARISLQRAESELSAARFKLAATWGGQSPRFTEAVGDLGQLTPVPDIDAVLDLAQRRPAIARWEAELARGQAALALAKAGRVPDLRVGAGVRWQENQDNQDYLLDLEISLPFFDRKQGDIREAQYDLARAQAARKSAEAAGSEGIAALYFQLTESMATAVTMRDEVVPAAQAAYDSLQRGFEVDPGNLGDFLDARRDLARAESDHTLALVDFHQSLAALEGIVGQSLGEAD
jgi:cobalt-zinc-cadmium efflux system outer membrane protein